MALFAKTGKEYLARILIPERIVHLGLPSSMRPLALRGSSYRQSPGGRATPLCYPSSERNGSMKVRWANGLPSIFVLALPLGAALSRAQSPPDAPAGVTASVSQNASENEAVVGVRVVSEDGRVLVDSPTRLQIQTGKPLDRTQIAESLRTLYRTGNYADLRAIAIPVPGGLRIDFVAREQLFFNQVVILGLAAPPTEASAAAAMQISLGQPYRREMVNDGVARLRETLHDEGLYGSEVSAETVPHAATHQMDVIVHVKAGPRARVKEIQLKNGTEFAMRRFFHA